MSHFYMSVFIRGRGLSGGVGEDMGLEHLKALRGLALVSEGWHAAHAKAVDDKDFARVGFFEFTVNSGGDEEAIEVRATEGTGGGLEARRL